MSMIKLKAKIYQYTGVFLANKEELEYLQSKEFWKSFKKIVLNKKNDLLMNSIQGFLIANWQCKHGFSTIMYRGKFKTLNRIYNQLKWDIKGLFK